MLERKPTNPRGISAVGDDTLSFSSNGRTDARPQSANLSLVLWRRRWIVLVCILGSLASAVVYLKKATPVYESTSVLYIQQRNAKILSDAVVSNETANLFTQCELIKSSSNLVAAAKKPDMAGTKVLRGVENPVAILKSMVAAEPGKQGDLIKVTVSCGDPVDASIIVNNVVAAYIEEQATQMKSTAAEVLKILDREKDRYEKELSQTSAAMVAFRKANPEIAFTNENEKGGSTGTTRLGALSDALTKAQLDALELQIESDEVATMGNDPIKLRQYFASRQAKSDEAGPASQLADLIRQRRNLTIHYGPENPQIKVLDRLIADAERDVMAADQDSTQSNVLRLASELKKAQTREKELAREVKEERSSAVDTNVKLADFDQMATQARRDERVLDMLDTQIKQVDVSDETRGMNVSILEIAKPNPRPVSPKGPQTLAVGLVIGLMLGLSGALLLDFMDQRLRSAEDISRLLGVPILGTIPHMVGKHTASQRGQEVHLRTRSDIAESYRTIRTAIYFGMPADSGRTILVTSPTPGDGKSTMASNLALAMAQAGRRVLLIDADCRRPTQHKIYDLRPESGLATVLLGRTTLESSTLKTSTDGLDILPCGPLPTNPSELLDSQAFLDLLKMTASKYDNVIIDSPPVIPVTDARILAASCDVTVLVLRAEKATRSLAQHAYDALASVGANILGVVVNDVPRGQKGYYYYYSAYGQYRYSYASNGSTANGNGNGADSEVKAITVAAARFES